jgi:hypothetical protein
LPPIAAPSQKLLDLIYDAATDPERWREVLIGITDMTGGGSGFIHGVDNWKRQVIFSFFARLSEQSISTYRQRHVANPLADVMNQCPAGKLVRTDDILALADFKRTGLFNEVWRPEEIAHGAMVPLAARESFQVGFNVYRWDRLGPYRADELRLLAQLYPHMRRSMLLGFRLDGYKALQRTEFDVLDRLSVARRSDQQNQILG